LHRVGVLIDTEAGELWIAALFGPDGAGHTHQKQEGHCGKKRPALTPIPSHSTKRMGQRCTNRENRDHLD
jgi:hypothetical protein